MEKEQITSIAKSILSLDVNDGIQFQLIVRLKEIVAEFDSSAFVIVSDAREVFGEGFIEY